MDETKLRTMAQLQEFLDATGLENTLLSLRAVDHVCIEQYVDLDWSGACVDTRRSARAAMYCKAMSG